jgi:hypothetical protein
MGLVLTMGLVLRARDSLLRGSFGVHLIYTKALSFPLLHSPLVYQKLLFLEQDLAAACLAWMHGRGRHAAMGLF